MQEFIKHGYTKVEFEGEADVYIVNTCTVTNISDRKSRQILRRAKHNSKNGILVATGCYAQVAEKILEDIEEIDIIVGNNEKKDIVQYVEEFKKKRQEKVKDIMKEKEYLEFGNITYTEKTRAVIKIEDGCNNFCTYCIVPYVRGRERSRNPRDILKEIEGLAKEGYKEITLLGQNVNSYNGGEGYKFSNLLRDVEKIDGIERIRFRS